MRKAAVSMFSDLMRDEVSRKLCDERLDEDSAIGHEFRSKVGSLLDDAIGWEFRSLASAYGHCYASAVIFQPTLIEFNPRTWKAVCAAGSILPHFWIDGNSIFDKCAFKFTLLHFVSDGNGWDAEISLVKSEFDLQIILFDRVRAGPAFENVSFLVVCQI